MHTINRGVSTFGWLDTDDAQARQVRAAIEALAEPEAADQLGTSSIRDSFAEALFPGTSTVQTRLRYFLFVPWICQALERSGRVDRQLFDQGLRKREVRLIEILRALGPGEGVIGYQAGPKLSRMPSSVYWHGLGAWRIRRHASMTPARYRDLVTQRRGPAAQRDEVDAVPDLNPIWDPELPPPPDASLSPQEPFPSGTIDLRVTLAEAQYLQDRMRQTHVPRPAWTDTPSLLAVLADDPGPWSGANSPWEGPIGGLPSKLAGLLRHAEFFSLLLHGGQLRYNALLCAEAGQHSGFPSDELSASLEKKLETWAITVTARSTDLRRWWSEPDEFWGAVRSIGGRDPVGTRHFLDEWITQAVRDPRGAGNDEHLAQRIREHELSLKGPHAKLSNLTALKSWRGKELGGDRLNYRWETVRGLLGDLRDGLTGVGPDARS